jgi:hypothetical protein
MKHKISLLFFLLTLGAAFIFAADKPFGVDLRPQGLYLNKAAAEPLSFHGATPSIQRSGSAQAAVTDTAATLTGTLTGTANGSLVDIAATAAATAGSAEPSAAQVDAGIATAVASIVTGVNEQNKEMQAQINKLVTDNAAQTVLINELRAALVEKGLITGS